MVILGNVARLSSSLVATFLRVRTLSRIINNGGDTSEEKIEELRRITRNERLRVERVEDRPP